MLAQMSGVPLTGVAYNDPGAMVIDVQAGRVSMSLISSVNALPRVRDGSLRALGVSSPARFAALPEVPTIAEQGLPGFDASAWVGLYAPARTPAAIVARINTDMRAALQEPEARSRLDTLGVQLVAGFLRNVDATVLVATHGLALARRMDRLWFVDQGCIVEAGAPDVLLRGDGPTARHFRPRSAA